MVIHFTKMQGLGNDFVVIDATREPFQLIHQHIQRLADRRFGIGFDQLLVLEPAQTKDVDFNYRIFNADGGEVAQCGNGARCMALFIKQKGLSDQREIKLKTGSQVMTLKLLGEDQVEVDMGVPIFEPKCIPFVTDATHPPYALQLNNERLNFGVVNMGNPHAILMVNDIQNAPVDRVGCQLNSHPAFPQGVNVGFMQIHSPQQMTLRVYERGAAETLACGSGACAAVAYGRTMGKLDETVVVTQAGGDLTLYWPGEGAHLRMRGPGKTVFEGHVSIDF